jgi:hypothetical protein
MGEKIDIISFYNRIFHLPDWTIPQFLSLPSKKNKLNLKS